jgi:hypothetical protein
MQSLMMVFLLCTFMGGYHYDDGYDESVTDGLIFPVFSWFFFKFELKF